MSSPSIDPIDYPGTEERLAFEEELANRSYYREQALIEEYEADLGLRR